MTKYTGLKNISLQIVTLSWGSFYGMISLTLGLSGLFPFIVWRNNGWGCLVSFIILLIWVAAITVMKWQGVLQEFFKTIQKS